MNEEANILQPPRLDEMPIYHEDMGVDIRNSVDLLEKNHMRISSEARTKEERHFKKLSKN